MDEDKHFTVHYQKDGFVCCWCFDFCADSSHWHFLLGKGRSA